MADAPASATGAAPDESPAQQQARLRRERRAAKLQAGESRLQAITALQGGTHRDVKKDLPAKPTPAAPPGTATPDPEEIDISEHHYAPASQPRLPSPFSFDGNTSLPPFGGAGEAPEGAQDMMAMLQQMMGGAAGGMPGAPGQPGGQPGHLPPGLANLFSAMGGNAPEPPPEQSSAWIWRLVHALFSLVLAIYIVCLTPFTGSKLSRDHVDDNEWRGNSTPADNFAHFFYLFATFEVVLQTSRYYIERGRLQGSGILSTIGQLLPEPYAGYVRVVGRYSVIYSTVVSDAMVIVFVLGAASFFKGGAAA